VYDRVVYSHMELDFYSPEQVADRLGLHVRTVRNYVRDGRLKAVRIGKQYRIAREDLAALTGRTAASDHDRAARRHIDVSTIVHVDAIGREPASRVTDALLAAAKGRDENDDPLRVDTIYDEERDRLKVVLTGSVSTTVVLLKLVAAYMD
jgi:excisionase family DNA binding protein